MAKTAEEWLEARGEGTVEVVDFVVFDEETTKWCQEVVGGERTAPRRVRRPHTQ